MAEKFGRPQIIISFQTKSTTAITRSGRGVGVLILNDENIRDEVVVHTIVDATEIPTSGLTDRNVDLIKKALLGTPSKLFLFWKYRRKLMKYKKKLKCRAKATQAIPQLQQP